MLKYKYQWSDCLKKQWNNVLHYTGSWSLLRNCGKHTSESPPWNVYPRTHPPLVEGQLATFTGCTCLQISTLPGAKGVLRRRWRTQASAGTLPTFWNCSVLGMLWELQLAQWAGINGVTQLPIKPYMVCWCYSNLVFNLLSFLVGWGNKWMWKAL